MRKSLDLFTFISVILVLFLLCGCSQKTKMPDLDKPEISFGSESDATDGVVSPIGYANKSEYMLINYYDMTFAVYYDLTDKDFVAIMVNNGKTARENILLSIFVHDEQKVGESYPWTLSKSESKQINLSGPNDRFSYWRAGISMDLSKRETKNREEPRVTIEKRIKNGKLVNLDSSLMRNYAKYRVGSNKGYEFEGKMFAGRHQTYVLAYGGLTVTVGYDMEKGCLAGTIKNTSGDTLNGFTLHMVYDGTRYETYNTKFTLKPYESKDLAYMGKLWDEFEIYRPTIVFDKGKEPADTHQEVKITDRY